MLLLTATLLPAEDCFRRLPPLTTSVDCFLRLPTLLLTATLIPVKDCLCQLPPSTASVRHRRPSLLTMLLTATSLPADNTPHCLILPGMED